MTKSDHNDQDVAKNLNEFGAFKTPSQNCQKKRVVELDPKPATF